ncbi:MAG: hypothetical protein WDN28_22725 [Chthoniobacter sp.]
MKFQPFGSLLSRALLAAALFLPTQFLAGQTVAPGGATPESDAAKRLEWLKSRVGAEATPPPAPPVIRKRFSDTRAPLLRPLEAPPADPAPPKNPPVETAPPPTPTPAPRTADTRPATPAPKKPRAGEHPPAETPAVAAHVPASPAASPRPKIARATATPTADPRPVAARTVDKPATTPRRPEASTPDARITDTHPVAVRTPTPAPVKMPPPATPAVRIANTNATNTSINNTTVTSRYPWKTGIVTTVFWIGEPVGGHNFTPNCSSSWDSNWTQAYGGYDNPNPEARRNFIPVNFTPRQNPFYVALPYNDVTRGTTKPEARVVIPWFKEAFRKEGQSVCRDRWIAIRSRTGRVGYAQWSDCGPFRTDHWQYVFGIEKPRPNLNQGAGLDVSPALRDYLGLQSTDVTDWKFVESKDVPPGPWSLYGDNNTCPQKGSRLARDGVKPEVAVTRSHGF